MKTPRERSNALEISPFPLPNKSRHCHISKNQAQTQVQASPYEIQWQILVVGNNDFVYLHLSFGTSWPITVKVAQQDAYIRKFLSQSRCKFNYFNLNLPSCLEVLQKCNCKQALHCNQVPRAYLISYKICHKSLAESGSRGRTKEKTVNGLGSSCERAY